MGVSVACNRNPEYADEIEGIVHEIYNEMCIRDRSYPTKD